uniref:Uncharacterized protein n=1 Tax=Ganoderma boninense TaxID=34458 RepID=A0A5K1K641_9APHY|nr:Uncharacterized protein [Ganoderma boninense]
MDRFDILHRISGRGVLEPMAILAQLSKLELSGVRPEHILAEERDTDTVAEMLPFLQASRCHLVVLSLECWNVGNEYRLLDVVAAFPHLLTLKLVRFRPWHSFLSPSPRHARSMLPFIPSVRRLFLTGTTPAALDLVGLCPNVSLVSAGIRDLIWDMDEGDFPSPWPLTMDNTEALGPPWNPLRSIILSSKEGLHDVEAVLGSAFHLHIVPQLRCTNWAGSQYAPDVDQLLDIVKKVSPVRMQVSMEIGGEPMRFWERVAELAPRLRFLELKVTLQEGQQDEAISWLGNIPAALRPVPLVCLRLHLTKLPREFVSRADDWGPIYSPISSDAIQETYVTGQEVRRKLPQWCAGAIRTLKYIAVANEEPSWDDGSAHDTGSNRAPRSDWQSADERYGGSEADEYEYQNEWYAEKIKTLRWWRVERSVKGRWRRTKLRPLTLEKGKEMQRFLEEADFESIERINELLP